MVKNGINFSAREFLCCKRLLHLARRAARLQPAGAAAVGICIALPDSLIEFDLSEKIILATLCVRASG